MYVGIRFPIFTFLILSLTYQTYIMFILDSLLCVLHNY